jgi:uncharacterized protein (TIGR00255 family)
MPRFLSSLEMPIRQLVADTVRRGKISVNINVDAAQDPDSTYPINSKALKAYYRQLEKVRQELKIAAPISLADLVALPDVATAEKVEATTQELWEIVKPVVTKALKDLVAMRKKEGAAMANDMRKRLGILAKQIKKVEKQAPKVVDLYREKLKSRIEELQAGPVRDNQRLEEEISYIAERADVTEECIRFQSHLSQFRDALTSDKQVGKRLNFLLQELNREANTVGSKCADVVTSNTVITLKEEIEKLREQVQNAE